MDTKSLQQRLNYNTSIPLEVHPTPVRRCHTGCQNSVQHINLELDGLMMERQYDIKLKLLLIGDSSVGKSSVLIKFTDDTFNPTFITTVGEVLIKYYTVSILNFDLSGNLLELLACDSLASFSFV